MITYEQAIRLTHNDRVHYTGPNARGMNNICTTTLGPRGGIAVKTIECRVNGNVQTWKTRPTHFRIPIKYGMREYGEINHRNAGSWHLASECDDHYMRTLCAACGWTSSSDIPHNRYRGSLGVCRNAPQDTRTRSVAEIASDTTPPPAGMATLRGVNPPLDKLREIGARNAAAGNIIVEKTAEEPRNNWGETPEEESKLAEGYEQFYGARP